MIGWLSCCENRTPRECTHRWVAIKNVLPRMPSVPSTKITNVIGCWCWTIVVIFVFLCIFICRFLWGQNWNLCTTHIIAIEVDKHGFLSRDKTATTTNQAKISGKFTWQLLLGFTHTTACWLIFSIKLLMIDFIMVPVPGIFDHNSWYLVFFTITHDIARQGNDTKGIWNGVATCSGNRPATAAATIHKTRPRFQTSNLVLPKK